MKHTNINVNSMTFHCAVWGVFSNTTNSEMWRCKIRQEGYYTRIFITNKMKNELSFCFFSLIVMIFSVELRPVSGVVRKFKCPLKKRSLSVHAVGF